MYVKTTKNLQFEIDLMCASLATPKRGGPKDSPSKGLFSTPSFALAATGGAQAVPGSPTVVAAAAAPASATDEKNLESMSSLVRQLGVENAQLQKTKKDLSEQVESLIGELAKTKKEYMEKEQTLSSYTSKLVATVAQRKQKDAQVKQAAMRLKYGLRSFDDDDFDFQKSTPQERRQFFLDVRNKFFSCSNCAELYV